MPTTSGYACDTSHIIPLTSILKVVSCNVPGASITVNGNSVNIGDIITVSYGDVVIIAATATDYKPYSETITIGKEDVFVNINMKHNPDTFGGSLLLSPGPMYYDSTTSTYGICDTYNQYNSYGQNQSCTMTGNPQTYFTHMAMGTKFDSSGNTWESNVSSQSGNHTIDNQGTLVSYDGDND